eukprot:scaffold64815_cov34-Tisochrysis_lutea.AAC.5
MPLFCARANTVCLVTMWHSKCGFRSGELLQAESFWLRSLPELTFFLSTVCCRSSRVQRSATPPTAISMSASQSMRE